MMAQQLHGTFFGDLQKAIARALHEAGQTDREIADSVPTSVNNIIWWRKEEGLRENLPAGQEADAYTPPVSRTEVSPQSAAPTDPRLITPAQAQAAFAAPVQPTGDNAIEIGTYLDAKVFVDLDELLTTRLLIQGNSGSGKTHLLRKVLEECAGIVQQIIIDPEGDFEKFGETFGHTVINASEHTPARLRGFAGKARQLRGSVVLTLEGMDINRQLEAVAAFLDGLFDAAPEHWHPAIVAVDEAHLFAPAGDNGEDKEPRLLGRAAMANLMSRGRKRGLAGIIATQRLSKITKNVVAEASNYLIGRTLLDLDIARAADLLGLARADIERIRDLSRGQFLGLGPAVSRRPMKIEVGSVLTVGKAGEPKGLTPLPSLSAADMQALMLADDEADEEPAPRLRIVA